MHHDSDGKIRVVTYEDEEGEKAGRCHRAEYRRVYTVTMKDIRHQHPHRPYRQETMMSYSYTDDGEKGDGGGW